MVHHRPIESLVVGLCLLISWPFAATGQPTLEAVRMPTYQFSHAIAQTVQAATTPVQRTAATEQAAVASSFIGDYRAALQYVDRNAPAMPTISGADSLYFLGFRPQNAREYILARAGHEQIIMINEAHHVPLHRVFTLSLLAGLYHQGYRYLGAETLSEGDQGLAKRGYPVTSLTDFAANSGYYTAEPQYGNLIREALRLGFTVFAYDAFPNVPPADFARQREVQQARNIQKILQADPTAKILIHAGYDHIREDSLGGSWGKAMAGRVKEFTGIDPFTINQEKLSEKSEPRFENPYYKLAHASEASVFRNSDGQVFAGPRGTSLFDVRVYHPPTRYQDGRPDWLLLNGRRKPHAIPPRGHSVAYPCLVFAYRKQEDFRVAVAADIIELRTPQDRTALILEPGKYLLRFQDSNGTTTQRPLHVK
jgi:hypothetical protein